ncbi:sigma-70 family RNA polymerase sigma factor [Porticoccus sp. W117]|uniref:RNA polymerase sigma factor n=1 Tax=Porticoccus sp. W117 TaxID=3054777 RepID=UPI002591DBAA|nr:sigma-70 family RNA polymerase sigma factor [Porticoccus sp. W117]MDM3870838.1 sigma-70 family RNA polymerase sigma factor [Porticoccus sp. W117]
MAQKIDNVVDISQRRRGRQEQVLKRLFDEHGAPLRSFLAARLGARDDLDDLVQDVFFRLAKLEDLGDKMIHNKGSIRAYLFTIGNNLILDAKRKRQVRDSYAQSKQAFDEEHAHQVSPETVVSHRQELQIVKNAIMEMPAAWRKVFLLSRVELKSYRLISEQLGVSVKQVEKYMSKALKFVRDAVKAAHSQEAHNG